MLHALTGMEHVVARIQGLGNELCALLYSICCMPYRIKNKIARADPQLFSRRVSALLQFIRKCI